MNIAGAYSETRFANIIHTTSENLSICVADRLGDGCNQILSAYLYVFGLKDVYGIPIKREPTRVSRLNTVAENKSRFWC